MQCPQVNVHPSQTDLIIIIICLTAQMAKAKCQKVWGCSKSRSVWGGGVAGKETIRGVFQERMSHPAPECLCLGAISAKTIPAWNLGLKWCVKSETPGRITPGNLSSGTGHVSGKEKKSASSTYISYPFSSCQRQVRQGGGRNGGSLPESDLGFFIPAKNGMHNLVIMVAESIEEILPSPHNQSINH